MWFSLKQPANVVGGHVNRDQADDLHYARNRRQHGVHIVRRTNLNLLTTGNTAHGNTSWGDRAIARNSKLRTDLNARLDGGDVRPDQPPGRFIRADRVDRQRAEEVGGVAVNDFEL